MDWGGEGVTPAALPVPKDRGRVDLSTWGVGVPKRGGLEYLGRVVSSRGG